MHGVHCRLPMWGVWRISQCLRGSRPSPGGQSPGVAPRPSVPHPLLSPQCRSDSAAPHYYSKGALEMSASDGD